LDPATIFHADAAAMRDQDDVIFPDREAGNGVWAARGARDQKRRRIQPHGLVDHGRVNFSRSMSAASFVPRPAPRRQLLLCRWIEREQIQRPEQRGRRGFVTGEDHGRDWSPSCSSENAAPFRIAAAPSVEQVARRRVGILAGGAALRHQHRHEAVQRLRKKPREISCGLGQFSGNSRSRNAAAPASYRTPSRNHARSAVAVHPEREHGAPSDFELIRCIASRRSTGPPQAALSFAIVASVAAIICGTSVPTARGECGRGCGADASRYGLRRSAVRRPASASARDRGRGADIIFVIVDQHMPDRVRRVENETVAAEKAGLDDVLFIGTRTQVSMAFFRIATSAATGHGPARRARRTSGGRAAGMS